jgi:DnaK suppressor protein
MTHDAIRRQLQARVSDLMRRNDKVERSRRRERTPLEGDWKEDAVVRENDDVLEALDVEGSGQLIQLRAALQRLDDGSYGQCVTCEGPIATARLAAAPEITTCIGCATAAEQSTRR